MKPRVLLIQPPRLASQSSRMVFPRGLAQIGSFLKAHGWPVAVLPLQYAAVADITPRAVIRSIVEAVLAEFRPDVVGVGCPYTIGFHTSLDILRMVKAHREGIVTAIGGPHVTFTDAETAAVPEVDCVVRGEGEWAMAEWLDARERGADPADVAGLTFRRNGTVVRTPARPSGNLAELPPVDFGLFPEEFIQRCQVYGMIHRGCRHRCAFCAEAAFWGKERSLPVERLLAEIAELADRYGARMMGIEDSSQWLASPELGRLIRGLREVKRGLPPAFFMNLTVEALDDAKRGTLDALRAAGVGAIWLGIENSSEKVLAAMGKRRPWRRTLAMCRALRERGFLIKAEWMIGHPGDDPAEAEDALAKLDGLFRDDLVTSADFGVFVPLPGTRPWEDPAAYGIEILHRDWRGYDEFSITRPVCRLNGFPADRLADIARRTEAMIAHHTGTLRPARVITAPFGARPAILDAPPDAPAH
jgi:anaerobic magnesium-protoporphyrin IX monomethyl ester cyclase